MESKLGLLPLWCMVSAAIGFGMAFVVMPIVPPEMQSSDYNRGFEAGEKQWLKESMSLHEDGFSEGYAKAKQEITEQYSR